MRDRPFMGGGEAPRAFSEVRAEREGADAGRLRLRRTLEEIAALEALAFAEDASPADRKRCLCEAEGLRCAMDEFRRT